MATAAPTSTVAWLLNNISKAVRWRGNTPDGGGCVHDCEGGVDIPLPAGTPIYALATGPLLGSGTFNMGNGAFGHSVITQEVSGTGKVYYQHLDALPSIPQCTNGNCSGYVVQAGQLLGYSNSDIGEVEVGINPAWGGIWGPPTNGSGWVLDPRSALIALATNIGGNVNTGSGCVPCGAANVACCSPNVCTQTGVLSAFGACVTPQEAAAGVGSLFPKWLTNPDWGRVLEVVGGIIILGIALLGLFWPQAEQIISSAAKTAAVAA